MNTMKQNKRISKGNKVVAISGNNRGMSGTVLSVGDTHAVVQGLNIRKRHVRKTQENPQGGIVELEKPIHLSNLALCDENEKLLKPKVRFEKDGAKNLVAMKGNKEEVIRTLKKPKK